MTKTNKGGWKKYFKVADPGGTLSPISGNTNRGINYGTGYGSSGSSSEVSFRNYQSRLPEVYTGHPNRVERYNQYENMDMDAEINACLDILAEFCTQNNEKNDTPFELNFHDDPTDNEVEILKKQLKQWSKLNKLDQRMFKLFRNAIKYGDQVFLRDPETFEMYWVDMTKVNRVIVNESEGKEPEQYVVQDVNPNFQNLTVAPKTTTDHQVTPTSGGYQTQYNRTVPNAPLGQQGRFSTSVNEMCIDAKHVIHISLSEGLDVYWPFGQSILEMVFKVFKQKELLEDAILIYRVQRAPERRVFKIDTGDMPAHHAMQFVERIKNEIHQRRIPTTDGGGDSILDSSYNPLSMHEDYFFPHSCLSLDTEVKLLDDRSLPLSEIIKEYNEGKTNYAYTVNQQTQELEPGKIVWAGVTRRNAQVVKVTLDNGKSVTCTPDHRFIMRDGGEVEAQHLKAGDSVMPLYLHDASTSKYQGSNKYLRYTCPSDNKKKWVHTMVCPKQIAGKNTEIHHIDCNSRNNNPDNLVEMDTVEHRQLHKDLGSYHLTNAWKDPEKRQNLLDGIREYHKNATDIEKKMFAERGRINGANTWKNKESAEKVLKSLEKARQRVIKAKTISISDGMCNRLVELYDDGYDSIPKLVKKLREDDKFQQEFKSANKNLVRDKNRPDIMLPTDTSLRKMAVHMGYDDWRDFKESYAPNHKIISVEWLEDVIDTGDITIESASNSHNFALTVGIFVHNSDGRGSSVEVLPGGQNLGEIDDLKYFNNKLARGLRVPSSYLPTGPEDSERTSNDGRLGTALIQEHRFNQYCQRLQRLIIQKLDDEFKMFLRWRGFNIDAGLFDLTFTPPQNFASYRQAELDGTRINAFQSIEGLGYMSKRFALKRFLGLTEEEIVENETLWAEEQDQAGDLEAGGQDLRSVGMMPGDFDADLETADAMDLDLEGDDLDIGDMEGGDDMGAGEPEET